MNGRPTDEPLQDGSNIAETGSAPARVLFSDKTILIEYFRSSAGGASTLAFVFSSLGNKILGGGASGGALLSANGFDVIRFSSIANDWFQTVPEHALVAVAAAADEGGYKRRVALGSSMGGYGAICFSGRFSFDLVLAFNPQYRVSGWRDLRFAPIANKLDWKYLITPQSVSDTCEFCFVYDPRDFDAVHVASLCDLIGDARTFKIPLPFSGHTSMLYLYETGRLSDTVLSILRGTKTSARDLRRDKKKSRQYLIALASALDQKHPELAARVMALTGGNYTPPKATRWMTSLRFWPLAFIGKRLEMRRLRRMKFDEDFYLRVNWDVEVAGKDPIEHYVTTGWAEGRPARFG